ncbi:GntR family transcriptional regulator [Devosia sp. FKR38]|uniref:GntR family transcriptional regulator n=1 Tax=Devosia sp. FKR38 TaxID=2562312 RepID=UPI0010BFE52B|nr:GntR family transcriptional regulator [Devosia sp. FKR38]
MKTDTVFKQAFNQTLTLLSAAGTGAPLPSENALSADLGVSRTTVRKVLAHLAERGYITGQGRNRIIATAVPDDAHFPHTETIATAQQVEVHFMEWMLRGHAQPGTQINELELARAFGVGTTGIREFLNRFRRFGLIAKRPNAGWVFMGFTRDFAMELFEIREMFELRSARALVRLPDSATIWPRLRAIERQHHELLNQIDARFQDFSDLDNRFHRLINSAVPNRFIDDFYDIITFIFHYHYQWNKRDERLRNETAIREHLAYIQALFSRDLVQVHAACSLHLASARKTMLAAFDAH